MFNNYVPHVLTWIYVFGDANFECLQHFETYFCAWLTGIIMSWQSSFSHTDLPAGRHVFHLVDNTYSVTFTELIETLKRVFVPTMATRGECHVHIFTSW